MANKSLAVIVLISVVGLLFLVYLAATYDSPDGSATVELEAPVPRAPDPVERVPAPVTPAPEVTEAPTQPPPSEPAEPEPAPEPAPELPPLNESDSFVLPRLAALEQGERLMEVLATEDLVRKFVVFTDNIANGNLPQLEYPVQRITEEMQVEEVDDNLYVMDPAAHKRFDRIIDTFVAIDVDAGLALFRMMGPLFQDAYAEIGYGNRSFDAAVVSAIDNVLEARTVEGPFELVKPSVMYLYAEQHIEDLSPVEKQLIRIGPENAEKLKARLAEYKSRLQELR